jgi:hypothetical protein
MEAETNPEWRKVQFGVADDLKPVLGEIKEYCKSRFAVFFGWPAGNYTNVDWWAPAGGTDYKQFLDAAAKLGVRMIYVGGGKVADADSIAVMGHEDEFGYLTLTFIHEQHRYNMWLYANWYRLKPAKVPGAKTEPDLSGYR